MLVACKKQIARHTAHEQQFANGLQRTMPGLIRRLKAHIIILIGADTGGSIGVSSIIVIVIVSRTAPVDDRFGDVHGHVVQVSELLQGSGVDVQPAFFVADAVDDSPALVLAATAEHAEFSTTERDVAKIVRVVVKFAAVIFSRGAAVMRVFIELCLGFFDSGQCEVMRLDAVAIIFSSYQIDSRSVQDTDDDQREKCNAPEEPHEDGGAVERTSNSNIQWHAEFAVIGRSANHWVIPPVGGPGLD